MNSLLTSPKLINCQLNDEWVTVAHKAVVRRSIEAAKWVVSKGFDLTILWYGFGSPNIGKTAYEYAKGLAADGTFSQNSRETWSQIAEILKPPPAPATKTCAEVDGQTPPANEYCIVAENVQSSRKRELNRFEKLFTGLDDLYVIYSGLSGTGLHPGWTAEFTFTCSAQSQGCGDSNYNFEYLDENQSKYLRDRIREAYGFSVFCNDSGNLLDAKEVEAGESVSFTHSSETERSSPWYQACSANSAGPFTLSIKTTRLAR